MRYCWFLRLVKAPRTMNNVICRRSERRWRINAPVLLTFRVWPWRAVKIIIMFKTFTAFVENTNYFLVCTGWLQVQREQVRRKRFEDKLAGENVCCTEAFRNIYPDSDVTLCFHPVGRRAFIIYDAREISRGRPSEFTRRVHYFYNEQFGICRLNYDF